MGDGTEPIEDDERLYRRIQLVHFDPAYGSQPASVSSPELRYDGPLRVQGEVRDSRASDGE